MPKLMPESVSFGFKILEMPTLEEVGIPLAGLGFIRRHESLKGGGYEPCWIERGDPLLLYRFRYFQNRDKGLLSMLWDPTQDEAFEVASPISGLLLSLRQEYTLGYLGSLQYEWSEEPLLPVILVPEDEPPPDLSVFSEFDKIASLLVKHLDVLPFRDRTRTRPERLHELIGRGGVEVEERYEAYRKQLGLRKPGSHKAFGVRELCASDKDLVSTVQILRGKDLVLRSKLVHISRRFGESI